MAVVANSAIGINQPYVVVLPDLKAATPDQGELQDIAYSYAGVLAATPGAVLVTNNPFDSRVFVSRVIARAV